MIRFFDIFFSLIGILLLMPLFIVVYLLIRVESKGNAFYIQNRIGKNGTEFKLLKFRSMRPGSDKKSLITIGERDSRLTNMGAFIRRFKLDELPQLFNVLIGDMSLVGPRPEVKLYVDLYTLDQQMVLSVCPGITDYASIEFIDENVILGSAKDPHKVYIEEILPKKIQLNKKYIQNRTVKEYFKIIFLTFWQIIKK